MDKLLHFSLFALALTAVTQARADDDGDYRRGKKVVVAYEHGTRRARPARATPDPPRFVYDSRRASHERGKASHAARRDFFDQQENLTQITRITNRWHEAAANRNGHVQWKVNRRIDAWLDREIRESANQPWNGRYSEKLRALSYELDVIERRYDRQRLHAANEWYGRGYRGRGYHPVGYRGRSRHRAVEREYFEQKAALLDRLVQVSERQLRRAQARLHRPHRVTYEYR